MRALCSCSAQHLALPQPKPVSANVQFQHLTVHKYAVLHLFLFYLCSHLAGNGVGWTCVLRAFLGERFPQVTGMDFLGAYTQYCDEHELKALPGVKEAVDISVATQSSTCSVQVRGGAVNDAQVEALVFGLARSALPNFELRLRYGVITNAAISALCSVLEDNVGVSHLDLSWNDITGEGVAQLAKALASNTKLVGLVLDGNAVGDEGGRALGALLQASATLRHLSLARTGLGTDSVKHLGNALRTNRSLVSLNVEDSRSEGCVRDLITTLRDNRGLTAVSFAKCPWMDDEGAELLADAVWENPRLAQLDLTACKVSGPGVCSLAPWLASDPPLEVLKLTRCRVCDEGAVALAAALASNSALRELWLDHAEIGQTGLVALLGAVAAHPALSLVKLWGNDWQAGTASAEALRQVIEGCGGGVEGVDGTKTGHTGGASEGAAAAEAAGVSVTPLRMDVIVYEIDGAACVAAGQGVC